MSHHDNLIIGLGIGAIVGATVLSRPSTVSSPHQPIISKPLIPIKFGRVIKKMGLEFEIQGHKFLGLLDSGMLGQTKVMLDERTAEMVGIHRFRRSNRVATTTFIETGKHQQPIYENIPLTIRGVSTVITDAIVGGNNLVNPSIFLGNYDIAFHSNKMWGPLSVGFLPKNTPHIGVSIPYLKGNETLFNWNIAGRHTPFLIDSGGDWSMVNAKVAHDIGLTAYEKIARYDTAEDDFEFAYITPVSLLGTPVQYISEMHIGKGPSIISGPELLEAGWAFTLRDKYAEFYHSI